jgi:hypothetical protein
MASAADLFGNTVNLERTPAMRTSTPSSRNSRSARFAVMRDTPKDLTMSFSEGTRDAALHLPEPMLSRICRFTCRYRGCTEAEALPIGRI